LNWRENPSEEKTLRPLKKEEGGRTETDPKKIRRSMGGGEEAASGKGKEKCGFNVCLRLLRRAAARAGKTGSYTGKAACDYKGRAERVYLREEKQRRRMFWKNFRGVSGGKREGAGWIQDLEYRGRAASQSGEGGGEFVERKRKRGIASRPGEKEKYFSRQLEQGVEHKEGESVWLYSSRAESRSFGKRKRRGGGKEIDSNDRKKNCPPPRPDKRVRQPGGKNILQAFSCSKSPKEG